MKMRQSEIGVWLSAVNATLHAGTGGAEYAAKYAIRTADEIVEAFRERLPQEQTPDSGGAADPGK